MRAKNEEARATFELSDTERVVQNYSCTKGGSPSTLWITYNFICISSKVGSAAEKFPFRIITDIRKARSAGIFTAAIDIKTEEQEYNLGNFVHRDECFFLLMHLWRHPPQFLVFHEKLNDDLGGDPNDLSGVYIEGIKGNRNVDNKRQYGFGGSGGGFGDEEYDSSEEYDEDLEDDDEASQFNWFGMKKRKNMAEGIVDTHTAARAVDLAEETKYIGNDTLAELERQGEQIDRIERGVAKLHANLEEGERVLRKINSPAGAGLNMAMDDIKRTVESQMPVGFSMPTVPIPGITAGFLPGDRHASNAPISRELQLKDIPLEDTDILILIKQSNDKFRPGILRLNALHGFYCVDWFTRKKIKSLSWTYQDVSQVVVRARPLHLDVRFKTSRNNRFRLCSAFIQAVVNEMVLRTTARVVFEPGTETFDYGSRKIVIRSKITDNDGPGGAVFFGVVHNTSDLISKTAHKDIKEALVQQEGDVDHIAHNLKDLRSIAETMSDELDRQLNQLDHISTEVASARQRIHNDTYAVGRAAHTQ